MLLDLVYLLALLALLPWLVWRSVRTGRYRRGLAAKLLGRVRVNNPHRKPVAWVHAVSVGEVNLLGTLVPAFRRRHPGWHVVVSSTTDTGLAEARRRFPDLDVIAWPFDFSWAVGTALDAVRPSLVILTESELWPNFLAAARARKVPVVVVNARLSPRSARRLKRVAGVARRLFFRNVSRFAVQESDYAVRLEQLGVPATNLVVTGSIKYDGALRSRATPETERLRELIGSPASLVLLAGSTHAPEESIVLGVFARLRVRFPDSRLILVPRHPDRFEEVARLVEASGLSFVRRSAVTSPLPEMPAVLLLDTVGELGAAWGLAGVGFVGGSLDGQRGGQSMIEPAGYGVPCVFGPHVWNFRDAARRLVEVGGAVTLKDAAELEAALAQLLADPGLRERMGVSARELVRQQQGATERTLAVIDSVLTSPSLSRVA
ncbi:MAG: 3-deoxy-D-manno-octulosonic acid transferase [Gemmataceae bacterium]|nr:3-deoxy-D-manno-octulosonic acid transferase [Gemmataceae bacterium]